MKAKTAASEWIVTYPAEIMVYPYATNLPPLRILPPP